MDYRKKILNLSLVILLCTGVVACSHTRNREEEVLIKGFLKEYYAQLSYTQGEKEKIEQEIEQLQTKISLVGENNDKPSREIRSDDFYYFFKNNLSPRLFEMMVSNRRLPDFKMLEADFDKSKVKDLKLEKKDDIIHTSFKVECYLQEDFIEEKIIEIDFELKQIEDKLYIDSINGYLGWD